MYEHEMTYEAAREQLMAAMRNLEQVVEPIRAMSPAMSPEYPTYSTNERNRMHVNYWKGVQIEEHPAYQDAMYAFSLYLPHCLERRNTNRKLVSMLTDTKFGQSRDDVQQDVSIMFLSHFKVIHILDNVHENYVSKKGSVSTEEGYILYLETAISNTLMDMVRKQNSPNRLDMNFDMCSLDDIHPVNNQSSNLRRGDTVADLAPNPEEALLLDEERTMTVSFPMRAALERTMDKLSTKPLQAFMLQVYLHEMLTGKKIHYPALRDAIRGNEQLYLRLVHTNMALLGMPCSRQWNVTIRADIPENQLSKAKSRAKTQFQDALKKEMGR